jgi:hypothetical protein
MKRPTNESLLTMLGTVVQVLAISLVGYELAVHVRVVAQHVKLFSCLNRRKVLAKSCEASIN